MNDGEFFSVTDHITGEETIYEKLFIIESTDGSGKNYIVYTDNTTVEDGSLKIYASILEKYEDSTYRMIEIETEEEWSIIEQALDELQKDVE